MCAILRRDSPLQGCVFIRDIYGSLFFIYLFTYELQGCVFTRDIDRAIGIADAMETGSVQVSHRGP